MEFRKVLALRGPNIWANFPVLEAWVDLEELKDSPSDELPGFNERLMAWLPTMIEHRCSVGERGGFFERLRRGTYLAPHPRARHARTANAGRHAGRLRPRPRDVRSRASTKSSSNTTKKSWAAPAWPRPASCAWPRFTTGRSTSPAESREAATIWRTKFASARAPASIVGAAEARGIPVRRLNAGSLVQFGYGARQRRILDRRDRSHRRHRRVDRAGQGTDPHAAARRSACRCPTGRPVADAEDAWEAAAGDRRAGGRQAAVRQSGPRRGHEPDHARASRGGLCRGPRGRLERSWSRSSPPAPTTACWSSATSWWPPPAASRPT